MATMAPPPRGGKRPGAGRPRLSPDKKRSRRDIYLRPDTWAHIDANRRKHGLTTSEAVEQMVLASLERMGIPIPDDD
mgnify:CR=1 FL=1